MNGINIDRRELGLNFKPTGDADICLWSPLSDSVSLEFPSNKERISLQKDEEGYWHHRSDNIRPGDTYFFSIDGGASMPDPASLAQLETVHGPSVATDLSAFRWSDNEWKNPDLEQYIFYELHTGTFTQGGRFSDIEERLGYLKELGISAIEIMPVAQFPGGRNWGYDGVLPYAVQNTYGGAHGLQQLVNACHAKGLAVVLDVVYNHLGPEGNYLGSFGPYFTSKYNTPWGQAINFDDAWCDGVRRYYIENALMWFRDFHVDALRLDAVHAIKDFSAIHILQDIRRHVDQLIAATGRKYYLIVELDLNDTRFLNPEAAGGYAMDGQWVDEFHHALRVSSGGERTGYYEDFNGIGHLAKAYRDGYVYDGQFSPHRKKRFGIPATGFNGQQFVVFSQNHDQVGNRMLGERTSVLVSKEMQKLMAAAVFVSPFLPMIFMGEEWSEPNPFQYFISHTDPELVKAVRKGRKAEFAAFHLEGEAKDPAAESTFNESKLQWRLLQQGVHQSMLKFYKALINLRKINPVLNHLNRQHLQVEEDLQNNMLVLRRWHNDKELVCMLNFSDVPKTLHVPANSGQQFEKIFDSADPIWGGPLASPAFPETTGNGYTPFNIQPESILIYTTVHV